MTASETGREIPADVRALAVSLVTMMPSRSPFKFEVENAIMAGIMADRATRIASLEAERARAVEAYRAGVEETCREWATPESWSDAESTQQGLDDRKRAAWVRTEMMKDWRVARALTLASEKGGQADG